MDETWSFSEIQYSLMSKWSSKRKLYLIELVIFEALLIAGVVLDLSGSGFGRTIAISGGLLAIMLIHLVLRLTYLKGVLSEPRWKLKWRRAKG